MTAIAEAKAIIPTRKFAPGASFFRQALNPLFATDAYKLDHRRQFRLSLDAEKGEVFERVYVNWTCRKSRIDGVDVSVHFGLQAFLLDFATDSFRSFFEADVDEVCAAFEHRVAMVVGPNEIGSDHIRALHAKGYLPLRFCAVPEGTLVPIGVPSFTVENTEDDFFWLPGFFEAPLSAAIWQASTTATLAWHMRQMLERAAMRTGTDLSFVDWQAHDFSFRGMPGLDAASASGAGHLLSFTGSDSMIAMDWIDYFYPGSPEDEVILGSIPATEHSVMCTGIAKLGEQEIMRRLVSDLYKSGPASIVSDSFDLFKVIDVYLPALKDLIEKREGKIVIRPDSGDPVKILCGDPDAKVGSSAYKGVIESLWDLFGGTFNSKNCKELSTKIGTIYGDGIYYERAEEIIAQLGAKGFASGTVVFGCGSWWYQMRTRDSLGSAVKMTYGRISGVGFNVLKDPITDDGTKKSATGRLAVLKKRNGELYQVQQATPEQEAQSLLQPVWENGEFIRFQPFSDVRGTLRRSTADRRRRMTKDY
jgi:nicotinamide phosphoribosyltransferase